MPFKERLQGGRVAAISGTEDAGLNGSDFRHGGSELKEVADTAGRICEAVERVIEGKSDVVRLAVTVLLAEGHLLIEDVPGVGNTLLAKSLATAIDCTVRRIQFTPDLLPSDITGVSVFSQETREFEFKPGPVFANIVVGDEINRASPKTQSALLESMEERQATVDGQTYKLAAPFMVIATQNPIEMEGTYPLPEAQRDRFTARLSMGYPALTAELEMLDSHGSRDPLDDLAPVADGADVAKAIEVVRTVYVAPDVRRYAVDIVSATRNTAELRLGASPRATLQLMRAARAAAALDDRDYVLPDDVRALAHPVLAHRLLPTPEAQISRRTTSDILTDLLARVAVPAPARVASPSRSATR
jgi:MoxR-like ATPase